MELDLRLLHLRAGGTAVNALDPQARIAVEGVRDHHLKREHTVDLTFRADEAQTAIREITMALALSQEFMEHDAAVSRQALDAILAKRMAGEGWGKIAHDLNPKLSHVGSEAKKTEMRVA